MSPSPADAVPNALDIDSFVRRVTGSDTAVRRVGPVLETARRARHATGKHALDRLEQDYATLLARPSLIAVDAERISMGSGWLPRVLALLDPSDWIAWACRDVARLPVERLTAITGETRAALGGRIKRGEQLVLRQLKSDVLLLGRDPVLLLQLEANLIELGHTVLASCSTPAALRRRFGTLAPDLCVVDLQPGDDPLERRMLDLLRSRFECPVVLTGGNRSIDPEQLPERSIMLTKPVDSDAFERACGRALLQLL